ncbi:MAG: hypothetical protein IPJ25_14930 [Rhodocyclaceae bacterium]|nr:hypothetical protein [Rhodocyclaceae bacterium]
METEALPVDEPSLVSQRSAPAREASPWTVQRNKFGILEIGGRTDDMQALLPELKRELPGANLLRRSNPDGSASLVVSKRIEEPTLRQAIDTVRSRFLPPSLLEQRRVASTNSLPETGARYDDITHVQKWCRSNARSSPNGARCKLRAVCQ